MPHVTRTKLDNVNHTLFTYTRVYAISKQHGILSLLLMKRQT